MFLMLPVFASGLLSIPTDEYYALSNVSNNCGVSYWRNKNWCTGKRIESPTYDYFIKTGQPAIAAIIKPMCYEGAITDPCTGAIIQDTANKDQEKFAQKLSGSFAWYGVVCDCTPSCEVDKIQLTNNNVTCDLNALDLSVLSALQVTESSSNPRTYHFFHSC